MGREGFVFTCHGRLRLPRLSWSATCMGATAAQSVLGGGGGGEREGYVFTCHGRLRLPRLSWSATCMGATAAQSVLGSRGRGWEEKGMYLPAMVG